MKKNNKTALMAAAFAAAMSFSACHSDREFASVYGPPPDTDSSLVTQTTQDGTEKVTGSSTVSLTTSATETETASSTESSTAYDQTTGSTSGTETETTSAPPDGTADTPAETASAGTIPDVDFPALYDPDNNNMQVLYGPPSFYS